MTIRKDMIQTVKRALSFQPDRRAAVAGFTAGRMNNDGGFRGLGTYSDLYYTVFAVEVLQAADERFCRERTAAFLREFECGRQLDLVHTAALIRCRAGLQNDGFSAGERAEFEWALDKFRCSGNGYCLSGRQAYPSAYGCFLAMGAYQDLGVQLPEPSEVRNCLETLSRPDGGFANEAMIPVSSVPATAAAMCIYHYLWRQHKTGPAAWLGGQLRSGGGFAAIPQAQNPDLLSTAIALHALRLCGADTKAMKDRCLLYIDNCYSREGFYRDSNGQEGDVEYTYYGLLASGNLLQ